ncbi:MAG: galactitol-1-phosphate 5-dehydrogenase [Chloroflexi bacterium]|nr:galactitol-1-phosphate 5-dehydrogenase [Chloroflexota bacterium]
MQALVHTAPYVLELQQWPTPTCGPDDLLIQVKACAICGSDVKGYSGKTGRRQPPIIMGHEAAGIVAAVGERVPGFAVGERVGFDSTIYCRRCAYCLSGHFNLCSDRQVIGVSEGTYRRHGAMAEYVAVPYWVAVHLPDNLGFAQAALAETVSIGVHAANRTPLRLGATVVIVGAGAIGLVCLQALHAKGAGRIIVTDIAPAKLALAQRLGADVTLRADEPDLPQRLLHATGPEGAEVVVEAVGLPSTVETALGAVRKGGAVALVGNVAPRVEIPLQGVVGRELDVFGVCASNGEYADCVALIAAGRFQVDPLISGYARLEDGQAVFDLLYSGAEDNVRTVFVFE